MPFYRRTQMGRLSLPSVNWGKQLKEGRTLGVHTKACSQSPQPQKTHTQRLNIRKQFLCHHPWPRTSIRRPSLRIIHISTFDTEEPSRFFWNFICFSQGHTKHVISFLWEPSELGFIMPILQMRKTRSNWLGNLSKVTHIISWIQGTCY